MSLATASPALDLEAIRAALKEQPDGVLDDVARRHGVPLRVVLDLLPEAASRSAPGARFAEIRSDLVDWGPVTFIVHTEDGVFETKAPLPPGSEARGYFNIHGESPLGGHLRIARCAAIYFVDRPFFGRRSYSLQRSLSDAMKSVNCSQTRFPASSGCGTPRQVRPDSESQGTALTRPDHAGPTRKSLPSGRVCPPSTTMVVPVM